MSETNRERRVEQQPAGARDIGEVLQAAGRSTRENESEAKILPDHAEKRSRRFCKQLNKIRQCADVFFTPRVTGRCSRATFGFGPRILGNTSRLTNTLWNLVPCLAPTSTPPSTSLNVSPSSLAVASVSVPLLRNSAQLRQEHGSPFTIAPAKPKPPRPSPRSSPPVAPR